MLGQFSLVVPLLVFLFDVSPQCSSQFHKVSSLHSHTSIVSNSIGENNGSKHVIHRIMKTGKFAKEDALHLRGGGLTKNRTLKISNKF